jgi:hypothetical protein
MGVGGNGVGGDGDVYLGEYTRAALRRLRTRAQRMMAFISLTVHGWSSGFLKRRCRVKSEGNHV